MKKTITILFISVITIIILGGRTEANLQSRPDATPRTTGTVSANFALIRQMESPNQAMGLNATISGTGIETSVANNIDVHMVKNTEWGTVAMLGTSSYGSVKSGVWGATDTTTGNKYGAYQMSVVGGTFEYVAGLLNTGDLNTTNVTAAGQKYYNKYTTTAQGKPGDATTECKNWKGSGIGAWFSSGTVIFYRSNNGIFSYNPYNAGGGGFIRAAVVCGARILISLT